MSSPPRFTEGFPRDVAVDALVAAFERGDFGRVRREAPIVREAGATPEVRDAAALLLARTKPDPQSAFFFALAGALLVLLSSYWWWMEH